MNGAGLAAAVSAASVTVPHALGLGLVAFAPLAMAFPVGAMALWSAALPGLLLALLVRARGVIYAPSTVVALLYGGILAIVARDAALLKLSAAQVLAVTSVTVAFAFLVQWALGALRLAALARFMPVSVSQGFAAGVGLSMILTQLRSGFGSGAGVLDALTLWHAGLAFGVVLAAWLLNKRWPKTPALLPAVILLAIVASWAPAGWFAPAAAPYPMSFFPLPDWSGVAWGAVARRLGPELASLAVLMALVNSLDVLVFRQELALEHDMRDDVNALLRRESLGGVACALIGLIPASTSASRTRVALSMQGGATGASYWHGGLMLLVALTGQLWLPWLPLAALAGALVVAGLRQLPASMLSALSWKQARGGFLQSWFVALVFAISGGALALVAGLVVATFALLQTSAANALRREHLDGQLRSRRLRRLEADQWITGRMHQVAVFELQGIVSFGVAAHIEEKVLARLRPEHRWVVLDATRVPAWDATGQKHMQSLARELGRRGIPMAIAGGMPQEDRGAQGGVAFVDLDHALEWVEDALLAERPEATGQRSETDALGDLGVGLEGEARLALMAHMKVQHVPAQTAVFAAGDLGTDIYFVQSGRVTLATEHEGGLRLASLGSGQAFGEMAFLNGIARTAHAYTGTAAAEMLVLQRKDFDAWAQQYPQEALGWMSRLAQVGIRRLGMTTRQLRAVLE